MVQAHKLVAFLGLPTDDFIGCGVLYGVRVPIFYGDGRVRCTLKKKRKRNGATCQR